MMVGDTSFPLGQAPVLWQTPVLHQLPQDAEPIILVDEGEVGIWWEKQYLGTLHPRLSAAHVLVYGMLRGSGPLGEDPSSDGCSSKLLI